MTGLDIFAAIVLVTLIIGIVAGWIILARLPGKIARQRGHPQADAINVGGWLGALALGIFWPIALVWAFTRPRDTDTGNEGDIDALRARIEALEARVSDREAMQ